MTENSADYPRFFGRRKGRPLSQNMHRLLDEVLPDVVIPADNDTLKLDDDTADTPLILEIGFGGGEHLAQLAAGQPESQFIGAEPFINGVVSLLRQIEDDQLQNIRIWPDDVRLLLARIPDNSLSGVYVMFPDPWPKFRHAGRRIINQDMLTRLSAKIRPQGFLRMASDHPVAKTWLLAEAIRHPDFIWTAKTAQDWRKRPEGWPETRYMAKGYREGRYPAWYDFRRMH